MYMMYPSLARSGIAAGLAIAALGACSPRVAPPAPKVVQDADQATGQAPAGKQPVSNSSTAQQSAAQLSGEVLRPEGHLIANATGRLAQDVAEGTLLAQVPQKAAQISLTDTEGRQIGSTVLTDDKGEFRFAQAGEAEGLFIVHADFEEAGQTLTFRALAFRAVGEKARVKVDTASSFIAEKARQLLKSKVLKPEDFNYPSYLYLAEKLRRSLVREQVPFMVPGSPDLQDTGDQLALDSAELADLFEKAAKPLRTPIAPWAVSQVMDSARLATVSVYTHEADAGLAGLHAVDARGIGYFPTLHSGGPAISVFKVGSTGSRASVGTLPADARSPVALAFGPDGQLHAADFSEVTREVRLLRAPQNPGPFTLVATASWPTVGRPEPAHLALDAGGNAAIAVPTHHVVLRLPSGGTTPVFIGGPGLAGFKDGQAAEARFRRPVSVSFADDGAILVADRDNAIIRRIGSDNAVSTIAGKVGDPSYRNGRSSYARFVAPSSVLAAGATIYVADEGARRVRRISPDGSVFTVAGGSSATSGDGPGHQAGFSRVDALAVDAAGALHVREAVSNAAGTVVGYRYRRIVRPGG
jgi:hypothetical protein